MSTAEPETELTLEEISRDPEVLIYRRIQHLFDCDGELEWFNGTILSYDKITKEYRVVYDNEEEEYSFPLIDDITNGEIRLVSSSYSCCLFIHLNSGPSPTLFQLCSPKICMFLL